MEALSQSNGYEDPDDIYSSDSFEILNTDDSDSNQKPTHASEWDDHDCKNLNEETTGHVSYGDKKITFNTIIEDHNRPKCKVVNVVATFNLGIRLNPPKNSLWFKDVFPVKYNPRGFAAMIAEAKIPGFPSVTLLGYPSGNMVETGALDEDHARLVAWTFAVYLRNKLDLPATVKDFKIRNLVSYLQLEHGVDLDRLSNNLGLLSSFEPSLIQCAIVRDVDHSYLVRLFYYSGSVVLTGSKERREIIEQYRDTFEKVKTFEMNPSSKNQKNEHKRKSNNLPSIKPNTKERGRHDKVLFDPMDPFLNLNSKKRKLVFEMAET